MRHFVPSVEFGYRVPHATRMDWSGFSDVDDSRLNVVFAEIRVFLAPLK